MFLCTLKQITQFISVVSRHSNSVLAIPVLFLMDTRQHMQSSSQLSLDTKLDVCVESVSHHARLGPIKLEFPLNGVHHCLARLSQHRGLLTKGISKGNHARSGAEEELVVHGQRGIRIRRQKDSAAPDVVEAERNLQVVDVKVQAAQHNADFRVQHRAVGNILKVRRRNVSPEAGVRAADERDALRGQLDFHAGLANGKDLVLAGRQLEDAVDVDGGGVGGAKDILGLAGDV